MNRPFQKEDGLRDGSRAYLPNEVYDTKLAADGAFLTKHGWAFSNFRTRDQLVPSGRIPNRHNRIDRLKDRSGRKRLANRR